MPDQVCDDCAAVGDAIKRIRAVPARGRVKTQEQLAAALHMDRSNLSSRESGKLHFRFCEVIEAAVALKCEVADLAPVLDPAPVTPEQVRTALRLLTRATRPPK